MSMRAFALIGALTLVACSSKPAGDASSETEAYVRQAAVGDMFEIQSSRLALTRTADDDIANFAQAMVDDHMRSSLGLKEAVDEADLDVDIPEQLDAKHEALLGRLRNAQSIEFDTLYAQIQADAHKEAYNLHRNYGEDGEIAALRRHANEVTPVIEHHLMEVQSLPGQ